MHRDKTIARIERCMQMATVSAAIAFLFIENPQQDGKGEQCSLDGFLDLQLLYAMPPIQSREASTNSVQQSGSIFTPIATSHSNP